MANPARVYWDACTWIAVINEERAVNKGGKAFEDRYTMCTSIIARAENKEFEIVASAFTLAEVCKCQESKTTQPNKLSGFLDHNYILVLPVDKNIGLKAQTLQVALDGKLKPADAIHIASAQRANVAELHTFDEVLLKLNGEIVADNGKAIKICRPNDRDLSGTLFEASNCNG